MDKELLNKISKLLDEKLAPIEREIKELKLQKNKNLQNDIIENLNYIKGYYYNRTQG